MNLGDLETTVLHESNSSFTTHSSCTPRVPVSQHFQALQLCPEARVSQQRAQQRIELEEEKALEDQVLNVLPGRVTGGSEKCQGHSPCPLSSSKQLMLMLCRRQLQQSGMLLCTSLLLLQPEGCLFLQPFARII